MYLHTYIYICTHDFREGELEIARLKENRAKIFGWLAFATAFLRGKHAGATLFHMQLRTPDISFNIDL